MADFTITKDGVTVHPLTGKVAAQDKPVEATTLTIGSGGTLIKKHLSKSVSWNPPQISSGGYASTTITISGAAVGNPVVVGVYPALPTGLFATGQVTQGDTVTVQIFNLSGSPVDLPDSTLRADVWQH